MGRMKIPGYESQVRAPGPVSGPASINAPIAAFGGASAAGLGDAAQGLRHASDVMMQRAEQSEISDMNAFFAETQADFTQKWQDTVQQAEPGDQTLAEKFNEDYGKHVDKYRENISTRAGQLYFDRESADMGSQFARTAGAAQAQLAGEKAVNDYKSVVNNLQSALMKDPSLYEKNIQLHENSLNGLVATGLLPRRKAMEMKTATEPELTMSAVRGWIQSDNMAMAKSKLANEFSGKLSSDQMYQMQGEIRMAEKAAETDAEHARIKAERVQKAEWDKLNAGFMKEFVAGNLTSNKIIKSGLPAFGEGSQNQWISMLRANAERKHKTDNATLVKVFDDINTGKITSDGQLNEMVIAKKLDMKEDLPYFTNMLHSRKTTEGKMVADSKDKMLALGMEAILEKDQFGNFQDNRASAAVQYQYQFNKEWDDQVKAGIPPWKLADPTQKEWMGERFIPYKKNSRERMQSIGSELKSERNSYGPAQFPEPEGQVEAGNIDLTNRPQVKNSDGKISTVRSIGVNFGDGVETVIPTVSEDGRIMTDEEAKAQYRRTKKHLGKFKTVEQAGEFAQLLHKQQERTLEATGKPGESLKEFLKRRGY